MNTQLFIENFEIELNDSVQFCLNKQFEDLSNPTTIINDWSKTVSIPFTAHNNKIFGYLYKPNRVIIRSNDPDSYKMMGMYFDPTKKLDFRLVYNTMTLMTGYAKVNLIKQSKGNGTYEMTLFGQLGKVFQEMNKITFDKTTDDSTYLINGSDYVSEYINRNLIYNSWTSAGQQHENLFTKYLEVPGGSIVNHPGYVVTDIIGFAPNNSFTEEFDYTTMQESSNSTRTLEKLLELVNFEASTGIAPSSVIPNGLLPREYGDYRSYLQLPYVYWNKLFQMFQKKAEEITGYTFDLDSSWFNTSNPYWYNLVYMLKNFNIKKGSEMPNTYTLAPTVATKQLQWSRNNGQIHYATELNMDLIITPVSEKYPRLDDNKIYIETYDNMNITNHTIDFYITGEMNHAHDILYTKDNLFYVYLNFVGQNGHTWTKTIGIYRADSDNNDVTSAALNIINGGGYTYTISYDNRYGTNQGSIDSSSNYGWHISVSGEKLLGLNKYTWGDYVTVSVSAKWLNNHTVFGASNTGSTSEFCWLSNMNIYLKFDVLSNVFTSNAYFDFNDLWNNEYNIFNEILKYCKMYRISISVDDINKQIIFKPFSKLFTNYKVIDWTDKVDKSKDIIMLPINFDSKYIMFNYKDYESKICKDYKQKYGLNFGEYKLITDYNFNTNKTDLFKDAKLSAVNTDNVLSFLNLVLKKIVYSFPNEIFIDNKDKDKKQVDTFGQYYFHCGLAEWNRETALKLVLPKISDDTTFMQNNSMYFYIVNQNYTISNTYPKLDIVNGNNICLFNIPKENYTYLNNYSGKNSIYTNFWDDYINERYNVQNKLVTCYIKLTPSDFINFEFNNFIKIDNHLYIVNKIYDYDITNSGTTKVDLVTVQNISGYTN